MGYVCTDPGDPTCKPAPGLIGVHRGQLNTGAFNYSSGTYLGPQAVQGSINNAVLRLQMRSSLYLIQWLELRLEQQLPAGISVQDSDVAWIKVWRSTSTDPRFHRDPVSGTDAMDTLLAQGKFVQGVAQLSVVDPALSGLPFTFLSNSTDTFYSQPGLSPPNAGIGLQSLTVSDFSLGPSGAGHTTIFNNPVKSAELPIVPTANTMYVDIAPASPAFALQDDRNVPIARFAVHTDVNATGTVLWQSLKADRICPKGYVGCPSSLDSLDTDIGVVRLYKSAANILQFNPSVDAAYDSTGKQPYLESFGNEIFSAGTSLLNFTTPIVVTTTTQIYFLTYDFSQFAGLGTTEGLSVQGTSYFAVQAPNSVSVSTFISPPVIIQEVTSVVTMGVNDIILNQAVSQVNQADENVPMVRFNMATDRARALWQSLNIQRSGGSQSLSKPSGRNTDVGFIRVWKDINQNDKLDSLDINLNEQDTQLIVAISSSQPATIDNPMPMVVASTQGFPSTGQGFVWCSNGELMQFTGGYGTTVVGLSTYPVINISSRAAIFGQGPTPYLNHLAGADIRKVDVYDQSNDNNVQYQLSLANPQTISPTPSVFFLSYNIGATAGKNDLVGVSILDKSWVGLSLPNVMSPNLNVNVDRLSTAGTGAQNFPFKGHTVAISPLTLRVTARTIAPSAASPGQGNVPVEQFTLTTSSDYVNISQLRLTQLGSVQRSTMTGEGGAARVSVWLDQYGDGAFLPTRNLLSGSVVHNGYAGGSLAFDKGVAVVNLFNAAGYPYVTVSTKPTNIFVAMDISSSDIFGNPTTGQTYGFSLELFTDIAGPGGAELSAAPDPANGVPGSPGVLQYRSARVSVSPAVIPLTPLIPK
ncbi:MAG: hypothetical protein NTX64_11915, partial [Elusimicrobia bacterium]|nr:hypothetical protein [Elusimicrobiota bacterium]